MTLNLADPPGSVRQRQARVVAASLRAAYAWSERKTHPEAMREIARMTGVVMEALGPGQGPTSPMQLVGLLRCPLGDLLSLTGGTDDPVAEAVLLNPRDGLADTAYDRACEYAQQLTQSMAAGWLPSWTRMRAEQIQHEVFAALVESGDPGSYVLGRRFLIDHPASDPEQLSSQLLAAGARLAARYSPLPPDQHYQAAGGRRWWWPCPVCQWPMTVTGDYVRCRYLPHQAVYQAVSGRTSSPPRLLRTDDRSPRCVPAARRAENAVCVDPGVWRYIVVPGASEVRIATSLEKLGADVRLWPDMDAYDLHVRAGRLERRLDVKEYRSARRLVEDLRDKPPSVTILLPASHEHQLDVISAGLPTVKVMTETALRRQVRQADGRKQ
jgi:hypothetical protein